MTELLGEPDDGSETPPFPSAVPSLRSSPSPLPTTPSPPASPPAPPVAPVANQEHSDNWATDWDVDLTPFYRPRLPDEESLITDEREMAMESALETEEESDGVTSFYCTSEEMELWSAIGREARREVEVDRYYLEYYCFRNYPYSFEHHYWNADDDEDSENGGVKLYL